MNTDSQINISKRLPTTLALQSQYLVFSRLWVVIAALVFYVLESEIEHHFRYEPYLLLSIPSLCILLIAYSVHRSGCRELAMLHKARDGVYAFFWEYNAEESDRLSQVLASRIRRSDRLWIGIPASIGVGAAITFGVGLMWTGHEVLTALTTSMKVAVIAACVACSIAVTRWIAYFSRRYILKHSKLGVLFLNDRIWIAGESIILKHWDACSFTMRELDGAKLLEVELVRSNPKTGVTKRNLLLPVPQNRELDVEPIRLHYSRRSKRT